MKKRSQIELLSTQYSEFSNGSRAYDPLQHQLDEIVRTPLNRSEDIHHHFTPCKLVTLTWQPCLGKLPAFSAVFGVIEKREYFANYFPKCKYQFDRLTSTDVLFLLAVPASLLWIKASLCMSH